MHYFLLVVGLIFFACVTSFTALGVLVTYLVFAALAVKIATRLITAEPAPFSSALKAVTYSTLLVLLMTTVYASYLATPGHHLPGYVALIGLFASYAFGFMIALEISFGSSILLSVLTTLICCGFGYFAETLLHKAPA